MPFLHLSAPMPRTSIQYPTRWQGIHPRTFSIPIPCPRHATSHRLLLPHWSPPPVTISAWGRTRCRAGRCRAGRCLQVNKRQGGSQGTSARRSDQRSSFGMFIDPYIRHRRRRPRGGFVIMVDVVGAPGSVDRRFPARWQRRLGRRLQQDTIRRLSSQQRSLECAWSAPEPPALCIITGAPRNPFPQVALSMHGHHPPPFEQRTSIPAADLLVGHPSQEDLPSSPVAAFPSQEDLPSSREAASPFPAPFPAPSQEASRAPAPSQEASRVPAPFPAASLAPAPSQEASPYQADLRAHLSRAYLLCRAITLVWLARAHVHMERQVRAQHLCLR